MNHVRRIVALTAALALLAPTVSYAQPAPSKAQLAEANTHFKKGFELWKDGDAQAALIEFRRAYELAPNYVVLYNIGQAYFTVQDYPAALNAFQKYLADGGRNIPATRRADVEKDIEKLKTRVANLEITVSVSDAEVSVDDAAVGKTPFAKPVVVSAGKHKISVSKEGYRSTAKVIEIAGQETQKVAFELESNSAPVAAAAAVPAESGAPAPAAPTPAKSDAPPAQSHSNTGPIVGWVATGLLTTGAVILGASALGAQGDLQAERAKQTTTDKLTAAADKTRTFANATDILIGSAVLAAGISVYLTVTNGPSSPKTGALPAPTVRLVATPSSVGFAGTF